MTSGVRMHFGDAVGTCDVVLVTLDTLRYDVAAELMAAGRTPNLARATGGWERRHSPGSFTYAAHQAFLAGFLPTPTAPGRHERLFAASFPGSETTGEHTWVFDAPDVVHALAGVGYRTVCVGGVGFFSGRSALGGVLPGLFAEHYWQSGFGVTDPRCVDNQLERVARVLADDERLVFLLLNVAALHQPNRHYLPAAREDTRASHAAALEYVDSRMDRLFAMLSARRQPCYVIICSDHGTAYGEGGYSGHRVAHDVVWTVPYAQFVLWPGQW